MTSRILPGPRGVPAGHRLHPGRRSPRGSAPTAARAVAARHPRRRTWSPTPRTARRSPAASSPTTRSTAPGADSRSCGTANEHVLGHLPLRADALRPRPRAARPAAPGPAGGRRAARLPRRTEPLPGAGLIVGGHPPASAAPGARGELVDLVGRSTEPPAGGWRPAACSRTTAASTSSSTTCPTSSGSVRVWSPARPRTTSSPRSAARPRASRTSPTIPAPTGSSR